eukprot:3421519-Rhodomonas_salina.4
MPSGLVLRQCYAQHIQVLCPLVLVSAAMLRQAARPPCTHPTCALQVPPCASDTHPSLHAR